MKMKLIAVVCVAVFSVFMTNAQVSKIIPYPHCVQLETGQFKVNTQTRVVYDDMRFKPEADYLAKVLGISEVNLEYLSQRQTKENVIYLQSNRILGEEAYKVDINERNVICQASTPKGIAFAFTTLTQCISDKTWENMKIEDAPKYAWRGLMLDYSRHFFDIEVTKKMLDVMAHLKMNVFHMHLTDENGWRVEIKKYPKLTEIGAEGNWSDMNAPRRFYTQEQIKEIVAYAAERHIMVIPEIDMPGHATAASKAYPEISGGGEGRWQGFTFHPTKDVTYNFIEDILDEIFELFPAPYIHIGGDEVHFGNQSWKTDKVIQQFIKDNNLGDEVGLEHYFIRRVCDMINEKGRKMIGWDEIISSGVTPEQAIVMWWRHDREKDLAAALKKGFNVILTPRIPCYLDFVQDDSQRIGRRWNGFSSLQLGYEFPGEISHLLKGYEDKILGLQANVWTERIADVTRLYYMTFPRLAGLSEAGWAGEGEKRYEIFLERIKLFLRYLDSKNINYFNPFDKKSTPEPWGPTKQDVIAEG